MPAGSFGIRPNGKKLSAQVAGASLVEADVADVFGIGAADIKVLVEKTLRCKLSAESYAITYSCLFRPTCPMTREL